MHRAKAPCAMSPIPSDGGVPPDGRRPPQSFATLRGRRRQQPGVEPLSWREASRRHGVEFTPWLRIAELQGKQRSRWIRVGERSRAEGARGRCRKARRSRRIERQPENASRATHTQWPTITSGKRLSSKANLSQLQCEYWENRFRSD